jgi:translation initiation factor 1
VLTPDDLKELAKSLKSLCGSGGTAKYEADNQIIEIQGDHRERVAEKLRSLGYKVKGSLGISVGGSIYSGIGPPIKSGK